LTEGIIKKAKKQHVDIIEATLNKLADAPIMCPSSFLSGMTAGDSGLVIWSDIQMYLMKRFESNGPIKISKGGIVMSTATRYFTAVNLIGLILLSPFSLQRGVTINGATLPGARISVPRNKPQGNIDQEARQQANGFWGGKFTRCGASHYTRIRSAIFELQGFTVELRSNQLTRADKLNGIEWQGRSEIVASVSRTFTFGQGWSQWRQGHGFPIGLVILMRKQNGRWSFSSSDYSEVKSLTSIKCTDAANPAQLLKREKEQVIEKEIQAKRQEAPTMGIYSSNIPTPMFQAVHHDVGHGLYADAAFSNNGGWVVLRKYTGYWSNGLPPDAATKLKELGKAYCAAFAPNGGWVYIFSGKVFASNNIPKAMLDKLWEIYNSRNVEIKSVAFAPNGGWIIVYEATTPGSGFSRDRVETLTAYEEIPPEIITALTELINKRETIRQVAFASSGGWVILYASGGFRSNNIPQGALDALQDLNLKRKNIYNVVFAPKGGWLVVGQGRY
jgi:hypothetical protein